MTRGTLPARPRRRSLGQTILARTLAGRRKTVRKLVVGCDPSGRGVVVLRGSLARGGESVASSDECATLPR
jgi:hypothetical protein